MIRFGKLKFVTRKLESLLRIDERIIARGRLESRVPRCFTFLHAVKEASKGFLHSSQHVLQYLTVDTAQIFTNAFNLWKLDSLSVIVN